MNDTNDVANADATQREALARLATALTLYDVVAVLQALHDSGILAGLDRRVRIRWPSLKNDQDYYQIIAQATDRLVEAVGKRERIGEPVGFLWKVVERRACDEFRRRSREVSMDPKTIKGRIIPPLPADPREALEIARQLLPRVRGDNARAALVMILDAIEQGRQNLPASEISDTLGVSVEHARQLRVRGLERLARLAQEEDLAGRGFALPELWDDEEELRVEPDGGEPDDE